MLATRVAAWSAMAFARHAFARHAFQIGAFGVACVNRLHTAEGQLLARVHVCQLAEGTYCADGSGGGRRCRPEHPACCVPALSGLCSLERLEQVWVFCSCLPVVERSVVAPLAKVLRAALVGHAQGMQ